MRNLIVLGATGSIGTQALEIAAAYPEDIRIAALSAHGNASLLFEQVRLFRPRAAAITSGEVEIPEDLNFCQWYFGPHALKEIVRDIPCDDVLVAVVGMASLECVLQARKLSRRVLLANKETLVAGGQIIMPVCDVLGENPTLIPVDSEHSAIYQCLQAAQGNPFERLILTASGGPFRTWKQEDIMRATAKQALKHPNWEMGQKITIYSATMFNKALEIIEAKWLFDAAPKQIDVCVHPQSIVHSLVEFADGTQLAQLGTPDMRTPIMYAMIYPRRKAALGEKLDLAKLGTLTFEEVDEQRFPAIRMAYDAMGAEGAAPCILNAANEVAVAHFLKERIPFHAITDTVRSVLDGLSLPADSVEAILYADALARQKAEDYIQKLT